MDISFYGASVFQERPYFTVDVTGTQYRTHDRTAMLGTAARSSRPAGPGARSLPEYDQMDCGPAQ